MFCCAWVLRSGSSKSFMAKKQNRQKEVFNALLYLVNCTRIRITMSIRISWEASMTILCQSQEFKIKPSESQSISRHMTPAIPFAFRFEFTLMNCSCFCKFQAEWVFFSFPERSWKDYLFCAVITSYWGTSFHFLWCEHITEIQKQVKLI